jgi:hypothetical protein
MSVSAVLSQSVAGARVRREVMDCIETLAEGLNKEDVQRPCQVAANSDIWGVLSRECGCNSRNAANSVPGMDLSERG